MNIRPIKLGEITAEELSMLSKNHRDALRFDEGESFRTAAARLGISQGTLKSRSNRAKLAVLDLRERRKNLAAEQPQPST